MRPGIGGPRYRHTTALGAGGMATVYFADGCPYDMMPYIMGETLRDKLNRESQLGVEQPLRMTGTGLSRPTPTYQRARLQSGVPQRDGHVQLKHPRGVRLLGSPRTTNRSTHDGRTPASLRQRQGLAIVAR
jgi:hypothetical protein